MVEMRLGAIVPATEPDFSCCDSLFGGEMPCKGRPRPRRRVCFFLTPTEPSLTHCGSRTRETSHARQGTFVQPECIPKPSRKRPLEIQDLSAEEFPERRRGHGEARSFFSVASASLWDMLQLGQTSEASGRHTPPRLKRVSIASNELPAVRRGRPLVHRRVDLGRT